MELEYKAGKTEFKADAQVEGQYEGYFSVLGNLDDGGDIIEPGSFKKTLQERGDRIKIFYAHDWMKLIGPVPEILREDSYGLYAKGRLTLTSFWGAETWALMKDGALTEGSIGYNTVKADYGTDNEQSVRHIRELKLYEISPVPLAMNALSQVRAIKSALGKGGISSSDEPLQTYLETLKLIIQEINKKSLLIGDSAAVKSAIGNLHGVSNEIIQLLAAVEPHPMVHSTLLEKRARAASIALENLYH